MKSEKKQADGFERTAVRSRDIAIIGYDPGPQTLEIAFRSGGVYHYRGVPIEKYRELLAAPSHGVYFNQHIKDKYLASRVS